VSLVLLAGCSAPAAVDPDGGAAVIEGGDGTPEGVADVPEVPDVDDDPIDGEGDGPDAPLLTPRQGPTVLLHLDAPLADRDASDVVVRTEAGLVVERFRLPGATAIHAVDGGRWALVATASGQWARYDAQAGTLSLLTFTTAPPTGAPTLDGSVALWADPAAPWAVDLAVGTPVSLVGQLDVETALLDATPSGSHLLVRAGRDHVVDLHAGSARTLPGQTSVTMSADGTMLGSIAPGATGLDVHVERIDGSGRRLVGVVESTDAVAVAPDDDGTVAVPLPGDRILVLGVRSGVMEASGELLEMSPVPGVRQVVVTADSSRVLAATDGGLVLVDTAGRTVTPIANTAGYVLVPPGSPPSATSTSWGWSTASDQPGAVGVSLADGASIELLQDSPTAGITSVSDDGRTALAQTGAGVRYLDVDGSVEDLQQVGGRVDAVALHPTGGLLAAERISATAQEVVIRRADQLDDDATAGFAGHSPVWLRTSA
jgi:hypothetical protein